MPVLAFEKLSKEFKLGLRLRRVQAVRDVDLEVQQGEIFGYLGPNGAGKTTSMKMAMGLIRPTGGRALIFGESVERPAVRRRVGYLPEHPYFYDYLTGFEILDFYGQLYEMPKKKRHARVDELLTIVGLDHARDRTLRRFSKGMLQRIGIAQAILNDPDLVVLDEPMSGLDPMGRKEVRDIILALKEQGKTVFFSSHILHDIETICDRVAIIINGRVERMGSLGELLTGNAGLVEVVATGASPELLARLEGDGFTAAVAGHGHRLVVEEGGLDPVLRALLDGGATITHVEPMRESLEELFVREAGAHHAE
ncbi:MAG: ABC transporter ATP-binding protein [Deltaproteobacteria bacterium]|nr:ABC transporter ATP-binding protein [Deltaproteobacteria bacterium]MCB9785510.1 ABC transporter ATP-binding protein [Deltaproteobacteria bacterium]